MNNKIAFSIHLQHQIKFMDSCDRFYDDSLLFNEVFMTLLCKMVPKSP